MRLLVPLRLTHIKPMEALLEALFPLLDRNIEVELVGEGPADTVQFLEQVASEQTPRFTFRNEPAARKSYPFDAVCACSLESTRAPLREAMLAGLVPVVYRALAGRAGVNEYEPDSKCGNGFLIHALEPSAFFAAVVRAQTTFLRKNEWRALQRSAKRMARELE